MSSFHLLYLLPSRPSPLDFWFKTNRFIIKTLTVPKPPRFLPPARQAHPQSIIRAQAAQAAGELRVQDGLRGLDAILKQDLDVVARDAAEYVC